MFLSKEIHEPVKMLDYMTKGKYGCEKSEDLQATDSNLGML